MGNESWTSAQARTTAFLRRGAWELRMGHCGRSAFTLLLLFTIVLLSLRLLFSPSSAIVALTSTLSSNLRVGFKASSGANFLRWGSGSRAVELNGQKLQRGLPFSYPNGASNKFQCDLPFLRFQCDLDRNEGCKAYPQLFPSLALFTNWKQENTKQVPASIFDSICHFNISDPTEFRLAQMFREMDVPYVTYGIPELNAASKRWTDVYLTQQLGLTEQYRVHVTNQSHFMYFSKKQQLAGETDTYETRLMTYLQFVQAMNNSKLLQEAGMPHEYYYFMLKKKNFMTHASFVYDELQFLDPSQPEHDPRFGDLFVRDTAVAKEHGLRCRFGMQGIIADGHVDGGFNHVAIIRGTKRYVIAPPSVCPCLSLMAEGQSARHTTLNWSDTNALSEDERNCPAAEVALTAGEVLFIPSFWYHHIVSLDSSIQCNLRSGSSTRNESKEFLSDCGYKQ